MAKHVTQSEASPPSGPTHLFEEGRKGVGGLTSLLSLPAKGIQTTLRTR